MRKPVEEKKSEIGLSDGRRYPDFLSFFYNELPVEKNGGEGNVKAEHNRHSVLLFLCLSSTL